MTADDWPDWPPPPRTTHTHHLPEETPMPEPGLRQRVTDALIQWLPFPLPLLVNTDRLAERVLAVVRAELDAARADFGAALEIEAANTAREIDKAVAAEAEVERLTRKLANTVEVRDDAIRSLDTMQFARDAAASGVERLRSELAETTKALDVRRQQLVDTRAEVERLRAEAAEHGPGQCVHRLQHDAVQADWEDQLAAVRRARQLAEQWDAASAWTVLGSDGTESAAAELRDAIDDPTTDEQAHADLVRLDEELGLYPDQKPTTEETK